MNKLPSIALIHGWATEPTIWDPVRDPLESRGHDVTVYEMPGYGSRADESGDVTFDQLVDDAFDWIRECELWVGWSLGAMVALAAASGKPARCKAVFAICPTAKFCCDADKEVAMIRLRDSVESDAEKAVNRFRRSMPSSEFRRSVVAEIRKLSTTVVDQRIDCVQGTKTTLLAGLKILATTDLTANLTKIDVPVKILCGEQDTIIPCYSGEELHRQIANSTYTTMTCGHVPFLERPQQFMEQLYEFTEQITDSPSDSKSV